MAAGLMRRAAGDTVSVGSAGTEPGNTVNALSPQSSTAVTSVYTRPRSTVGAAGRARRA